MRAPPRDPARATLSIWECTRQTSYAFIRFFRRWFWYATGLPVIVVDDSLPYEGSAWINYSAAALRLPAEVILEQVCRWCAVWVWVPSTPNALF